MPATLTKCSKCDGCGKLDSKEKLPWNRFAGQIVYAIHTGEIQPVLCPDCKGQGQVAMKTPPVPAQPLVTATHRAEDGSILGVVLEDGTQVGTFPATAAAEDKTAAS